MRKKLKALGRRLRGEVVRDEFSVTKFEPLDINELPAEFEAEIDARVLAFAIPKGHSV